MRRSGGRPALRSAMPVPNLDRATHRVEYAAELDQAAVAGALNAVCDWRKQQAEAGDIVLLYGDESEALTHPYLARAWARPRWTGVCRRPGQAKKIAMLGSLDHVSGHLIVHTSPTKRSSDFVAHFEQLDRLYGPRPGQPIKLVVIVEDNGPIGTSKLSLATLPSARTGSRSSGCLNTLTSAGAGCRRSR
jgi:hypothetical protein